MTSSEFRTFSPDVLQELQTAYQRVNVMPSAERLWERHLSVEDRQRLGGSFPEACAMYNGTVGMWTVLRGVSFERAVVDVARLLGFLTGEDRGWLLRELGESADSEQALADAISAKHFVILEQPREAYWKGQKIDIDWDKHTAAWEFLWELCVCSKAGRGIDYFNLGRSAHSNIVADRKHRLINLEGFPLDFADLIQPIGRGTQRLELPREKIRIFNAGSGETFAERTAQPR